VAVFALALLSAVHGQALLSGQVDANTSGDADTGNISLPLGDSWNLTLALIDSSNLGPSSDNTACFWQASLYGVSDEIDIYIHINGVELAVYNETGQVFDIFQGASVGEDSVINLEYAANVTWTLKNDGLEVYEASAVNRSLDEGLATYNIGFYEQSILNPIEGAMAYVLSDTSHAEATPTPTPTATAQSSITIETPGMSATLFVFLLLTAWLCISLIIAVKVWDLFGVFAALAPGVALSLWLLQQGVIVVSPGQTLPFWPDLFWVPVMLIICNIAYPILKS